MSRKCFALTLAAVLLVSFPAAEAGPAEAGPHQLAQSFEITIHEGPSAGLVVIGNLTADVDPEKGTFEGTLVPGVDPDTGQRRTSVLFQCDAAGCTSLEDSAIQVRGQIDGHAVNVVLLDVTGPGKHIFGTGTTQFDTGKGLENDPGVIGGPAVGPEPGDRGDWEFSVTVCANLFFLSVCVTFS